MPCDFFPLFLHIPRTPPLTLLHLSASKFSVAPSAGGIAGFLSSDVVSTQSLFSSTQPSSEVKTSASCSQPGTIQSFFQKAAGKQKQAKNEIEEVSSEDVPTPVIADKESACESQLETKTNSPKSPFKSLSHSKGGSFSFRPGISSFFQKKSFERNSKVSASTSMPEPGPNPGILDADDCNDSDAAGSAHQALFEDIKKESDTDLKLHPQSDVGDFVCCEHCGQDVLVWELPEHNDYHFALDLQKSLSSSNSSAVTSPSGASSFSSASPAPLRWGAAQPSRGKTKTRGQSGPAAKRQRSQGGSVGTLDSFFKKNEK